MQLIARREDHLVAWLAALAVTIHIAEAALPSPVPGVKPGLANVITILALLHFGWRIAAWVTLLRILVGSLLLGTFLSPAFFLSLSGGLAALGALGLWRLLCRRDSLSGFGYSLIAAQAHMLGQFLAAWALFVPHPGLWALLPPLLTAAVLFGAVSGIIANHVARRVEV